MFIKLLGDNGEQTIIRKSDVYLVFTDDKQSIQICLPYGQTVAIPVKHLPEFYTALDSDYSAEIDIGQ